MKTDRSVSNARRVVSRRSVLVLCGGLGLVSPAAEAAVPAKIYVVNSAGDAGDAVHGDGSASTGGTVVRNGQPEPEVTLRSALTEADMTPALDEIRFDVPGAGVTIKPQGSVRGILGALQPVVIDGTTQPVDKIVIVDGTEAGTNDPAGREMVGIELVGAGSTVRGLFITAFAYDGVRIRPSGAPTGGNVIEGNVIMRNGRHGVYISDSADNLIGGTSAAAMNVVILNQGNGVRIDGQNAKANKIQGNRIGTDRTGTMNQSNLDDQIAIDRAPDTIIGEAHVAPPPAAPTGASNVIVGNRLGVRIDGLLTTKSTTTVNANFLGIEQVEATLSGGILSNGSLLTVGGNVITKVSGTEIQAFFQMDGNVDIRHNQLKGHALEGVNLRFDEGREMTLLLEQNVIVNARKGVVARESVGGNFTWTALDNTVEAEDEAFNLVFRGDGEKVFGGDWKAKTGVAFGYSADLGNGVGARLRIEAAAAGGSGGVVGSIETAGLFSYDAIGGRRSGGFGSGDKLTLGVGVTGRVEARYRDIEASFCAEAGFFLENKTAFRPFLTAFFERTASHDNIVGINLLSLRFGDTALDCTITNNRDAGIRLAGGTDGRIVGSTIAGNRIGVDVLDTSNAILIGNTLTGNGTALALFGSGVGTSLSGNSIFNNVGLGIDLGKNGVTPNDPGDFDSGPNNGQNFPVLTSAASSGGSTTIVGTLDSTANHTFVVEFFSNATTDPSGFGEGETPLGTTQATTNAGGQASFVATLPAGVAPGHSISSTATDRAGNTSEFSRSIQVGGSGTSTLTALMAEIEQSQFLNHGQKNSLTKKLEHAQSALERNKENGANHLNAFIAEVEAMRRSRRIPQSLADSWIAQAGSILR